MNASIFVLGSLNADLVIRADRLPTPGETLLGRDLSIHPGGKGANQACAAARMGAKAAMFGFVGQDVFGDLLLESLRNCGETRLASSGPIALPEAPQSRFFQMARTRFCSLLVRTQA